MKNHMNCQKWLPVVLQNRLRLMLIAFQSSGDGIRCVIISLGQGLSCDIINALDLTWNKRSAVKGAV